MRYRFFLLLLLLLLSSCSLLAPETPGYWPENVQASASGITATVLHVSHQEQRTSLDLQLDWEAQERRFDWSILQGPVLQDRYGKAASFQTLVQHEPGSTATLSFDAVPMSDPPLTLRFNSLLFQAPVSQTVTIPWSSAPVPGQEWRLNMQTVVAGFPVTWRSVRLEEVLLSGARNRLALTFDIQVEPASLLATDEMLVGLRLGVAGSDVRYESEVGPLALDGLLSPRLIFTELPQDPLTITIQEGLVVVRGPWETSWMPPER